MKKQKFLFMMMAALSLSSCNDELDNNQVIPIVTGDEIQFGASDLVTFGNGYSDVPESRTVYGTSRFENGKWHYPLNWVFGDSISVYCPQAIGTQFTHYRIEWEGGNLGDISNEETNAYMMKIGENGLHWGNTKDPHHFYAFYPASAILNDDQFKEGIVHGSIPNTQEMIWEETPEGNWVGKPNMSYALMRADTIITPELAQNDKVALKFKPLTTAVEVTLTVGKLSGGENDEVALSQLNVLATNRDGSQRQTVCGQYKYNIDTGTTTEVTPDVANAYMITIPCWRDVNKKQEPIRLKSGQSLTFTVFLLPRSDDNNPDRTLHNLQIRVPGWNSTARVKTYEGVTIPVGTKSQVILPDYVPNGDVNAWIGGLPKNVYISQLSIPGSVNAFSKEIKDDTGGYVKEESEIDQTQTLTIEEQFNSGVRAFEIATERGVFFDENLYLIAGEKKGDEFENSMKRLAKLVKNNPTEFVVVMPYYAPDATADNESWQSKYEKYFKGWQGSIDGVPIMPFDNSMTIGDAQGAILWLSRMPGDKDSFDPQYSTAIYGWNSDKDRWSKRGYAFDTWDGLNKPERTTVPITYDTWKYESEAPASVPTPTFYIQDWFRVCPISAKYVHPYVWDYGSSTNWFESKSEKIENIQDFMKSTIRELQNDKTGSKVFINSLAGYYIVSNSSGRSAIPYSPSSLVYPDYGKHGDIPSFACDMNTIFYNYILNLDYESRGPLGIVLVNYAGAAKAFGMEMHGDYIVRALIDNNYRFELKGE